MVVAGGVTGGGTEDTAFLVVVICEYLLFKFIKKLNLEKVLGG